MRAIVQRVTHAAVAINGKEHSRINEGLLILLGIEEMDEMQDLDWLVNKIIHLRVFKDANEKMNLSLLDVGGEALVVSQFTLFASTKKGTRPSFTQAAKPEVAIPLYEQFIIELNKKLQKQVKTGVFGADMQVSLINDGPVTIWLDTKNKE